MSSPPGNCKAGDVDFKSPLNLRSPDCDILQQGMDSWYWSRQNVYKKIKFEQDLYLSSWIQPDTFEKTLPSSVWPAHPTVLLENLLQPVKKHHCIGDF